MKIEKISSNRSFGGWHHRFTHTSAVLNCQMTFAIFLPPQVEAGANVPVLYWLSGLTCTDENFMQKAGAQKLAAELGIAIVCPDTSPRGEGVPDDAQGGWDFGLGAGFYVNATQAPWAVNYQMYDYVVTELPELIEANFPVTSKRAVSGHSMGGHGALVVGLRNPERYASISAFSPITNPINVPWGEKALGHYLGANIDSWKAYDACELVSKATQHLPILIDQGDADSFLAEQLTPQALTVAAAKAGYPLTLRMQSGYDHSYYFIASFVDDHLRFHAEYLNR